MALHKQKAVFTAEPKQLEDIAALVEAGRYGSASEFLREAIREKLERVRRKRIAEQVSRYCDSGHAGEDEDLIGAQAFDEEP